MDKNVKKLLAWVAENIEVEPLSGMMPYGPMWNVSAIPLLDRIGELWKLGEDEVGDVVNPIRERIEQERHKSLCDD